VLRPGPKVRGNERKQGSQGQHVKEKNTKIHGRVGDRLLTKVNKRHGEKHKNAKTLFSTRVASLKYRSFAIPHLN